ncbi:acyl-CoA dehydrogenase family protein [Ralstonia soli]|uniref:Acyl-CoA/acyl-ACP dehydrogenase n=1 Tax=Ralstonia soli TaxID=2953896 RepID=A0ABT1AG87_9RALS|nr:acyl-CoA dehydrogenase family protein [Ralstonia soli]MCO5397371.1 acyl-CoA/acyl-ACP dehydrogenase [Ralstonia soli]
MELSLSLEQEMIRDTAREFLDARSDSAAVRRVVDAVDAVDTEGPSAGHDPELWREVAELGWCGIALPEEVGGAGLGAPELVLLMEQMGRRLACVPYWSSVCLAAPALQGALAPAQAQAWLEPLALGTTRAALVLPVGTSPDPAGQLAPESLSVWAEAGEGGFVLHGRVDQVFDAVGAHWLLVPARIHDGAGGLALFWLDVAALANNPQLRVQPLTTLDRTRAVASVVFDALPVDAGGCLARGAEVARGIGGALWHGTLMLAAEQLGGAQQCLDLTVAYAAERIQFGRAIASFQAVKHRCAQMMVLTEAARSAIHGAAHAWQAAVAAEEAGAMDAARLDIAAARLAAEEAFAFCTQEAIQLHGGVGFTWEYDPQLYFKRAQAAAGWLGGTAAALDCVAGALAADHAE